MMMDHKYVPVKERDSIKSAAI